MSWPQACQKTVGRDETHMVQGGGKKTRSKPQAAARDCYLIT